MKCQTTFYLNTKLLLGDITGLVDIDHFHKNSSNNLFYRSTIVNDIINSPYKHLDNTVMRVSKCLNSTKFKLHLKYVDFLIKRK